MADPAIQTRPDIVPSQLPERIPFPHSSHAPPESTNVLLGDDPMRRPNAEAYEPHTGFGWPDGKPFLVKAQPQPR